MLAVPITLKKPVVDTNVVVALNTLKDSEAKLSAVCKSDRKLDPSAVSVRSTIGIIVVEALKSTPGWNPP